MPTTARVVDLSSGFEGSPVKSHQIRTQKRIQLFVPILRFLLPFRGILPFEGIKIEYYDKKSLSSESFYTPGGWALFAFVKIMGIR